ncbi:MAG: hypothetical protein NTV45_05805 [Firmicutes bacterium]|nr:hypothetical protein [Bacillota bacterium]
MTFVKWYEEVEKKSYQDLSPQEKQASECKFLAYLYRVHKDELTDICSKDEQNLPVSAPLAAHA